MDEKFAFLPAYLQLGTTLPSNSRSNEYCCNKVDLILDWVPNTSQAICRPSQRGCFKEVGVKSTSKRHLKAQPLNWWDQARRLSGLPSDSWLSVCRWRSRPVAIIEHQLTSSIITGKKPISRVLKELRRPTSTALGSQPSERLKMMEYD